MLIFPGVYKVAQGFQGDQYEIVVSIDLVVERFEGYLHSQPRPHDGFVPSTNSYDIGMQWAEMEGWEHVDSQVGIL